MTMVDPPKQSIKRLKNKPTSVTMSDMQPQQNPQSPQFFPPYQPVPGGPQPTATPPSVPNSAPLPTPQVPQAPQVPPVPPVQTSKPAGNSKALLIILIVFVVLALAAGGFAFWAYSGRQDYKNNVDQKVSAAVDTAVKQESDRKDAEFVDKEKQPFKTYTTPEPTGSIKITYPKTWSGYTNEDTKGNTLVDAYWHPDIVPGPGSNVAYALRLEVVNKAYADEIKSLDNLVKTGAIKVVPYSPKNVPKTVAVMVTGQVTKDKDTTMIIFPLRDKTVKLYTQSPDYVKDYKDTILDKLTFVP